LQRRREGGKGETAYGLLWFFSPLISHTHTFIQQPWLSLTCSSRIHRGKGERESENRTEPKPREAERKKGVLLSSLGSRWGRGSGMKGVETTGREREIEEKPGRWSRSKVSLSFLLLLLVHSVHSLCFCI
jgi:hypothetical protein